MMTSIKVLLVDDHAVVREGYRRLLEKHPSISVVGEADNGDDGYRLICDKKPDVAVLDITLPGMSGIEVARKVIVRVPSQNILMFSMHDDMLFVKRAFDAGAKGYVTKSSAPDQLVLAVQKVSKGEQYLSDDIAKRYAEEGSSRGGIHLDSLTKREFEVFRLLAIGQTVAEISEQLHVSYKTVANCQSNIRQKLDVSNATNLVKLALDHGIIAMADAPYDSDI
ncbi:MAG: response regulator transcription factor [Betaproteobacteria bacterium]